MALEDRQTGVGAMVHIESAVILEIASQRRSPLPACDLAFT